MSGRKYDLTFMQWFDSNYKNDPYTALEYILMLYNSEPGGKYDPVGAVRGKFNAFRMHFYEDNEREGKAVALTPEIVNTNLCENLRGYNKTQNKVDGADTLCQWFDNIYQKKKTQAILRLLQLYPIDDSNANTPVMEYAVSTFNALVKYDSSILETDKFLTAKWHGFVERLYAVDVSSIDYSKDLSFSEVCTAVKERIPEAVSTRDAFKAVMETAEELADYNLPAAMYDLIGFIYKTTDMANEVKASLTLLIIYYGIYSANLCIESRDVKYDVPPENNVYYSAGNCLIRIYGYCPEKFSAFTERAKKRVFMYQCYSINESFGVPPMEIFPTVSGGFKDLVSSVFDTIQLSSERCEEYTKTLSGTFTSNISKLYYLVGIIVTEHNFLHGNLKLAGIALKTLTHWLIVKCGINIRLQFLAQMVHETDAYAAGKRACVIDAKE